MSTAISILLIAVGVTMITMSSVLLYLVIVAKRTARQNRIIVKQK